MRARLQVLYHVWREHTPLWHEVLTAIYDRMGAPKDGPPPDLPHRILVRAWIKLKWQQVISHAAPRITSTGADP